MYHKKDSTRNTKSNNKILNINTACRCNKRLNGHKAHPGNNSQSRSKKLQTAFKVLNTRYIDNLYSRVYLLNQIFNFSPHIHKLTIKFPLRFQFFKIILQKGFDQMIFKCFSHYITMLWHPRGHDLNIHESPLPQGVSHFFPLVFFLYMFIC